MRVQLLSPDAAHLVGFAKKRLRQLKELRERTGQTVWSKNIAVGDFQIYLETAAWGDKIRLSGGGDGATLVFTDGQSVFTLFIPEFNLYEVESADFRFPKGSFSKRGEGGGWVNQEASDRVSNGANLLSFTDGKFKQVPHPVPGTAVVVPFRQFDIPLYFTGSELYIVVDGQRLLIASGWPAVLLPAKNNIVQNKAMVSLLTKFKSEWNKQDTVARWDIIPHNPSASYPVAWRWAPHLWNPELGNSMFLTQGIYYGTYGGSFHGPFKKATASFLGLLDNRGGGEVVSKGYCEIFKSSWDKEDDSPEVKHNILYFYGTMWEPGKGFFINYRRPAYTFHHSYSTSTIAPTFTISLGAEQEPPDEVVWWATEDIPPAPWSIMGLPRPCHGVLLVWRTTGSYRLYTHRGGGASLISSGIDYVDHSISYDGKYVALFTGEGAIQNVRIHDIYNWVGSQPGDRAAVDLVYDESFDLQWVNGELIPYDGREEPPEFPTPQPVTLAVDEFRTASKMPSFFGMTHPYPPSSGHTASGWKVDVTGGRDASGELWVDDCWEKTSYTEAPLPGDGAWDVDNLIKVDGTREVYGMGTRASGWLKPSGSGTVIKRTGISLNGWILGWGAPGEGVGVSINAKGPFDWSLSGNSEFVDAQGNKPSPSALAPNGQVGVNRIPDCNKQTVSVTDDCGYSADFEFEYNTPVSIGVIPSDPVGEGHIITVSGGALPVQLTHTNLSTSKIDDRTFEVTGITNCQPGAERSSQLTATDACGYGSSRVVRIVGGQWVTESSNPYPGFNHIWHRIVTGHTRTTYYYGADGGIPFPKYSACGKTCHYGPRSISCGTSRGGPAYVANSREFCGGTPGIKRWDDPSIPGIDGAGTVLYEYTTTQRLCESVTCNSFYLWCWKCWTRRPEYLTVQKWKCP